MAASQNSDILGCQCVFSRSGVSEASFFLSLKYPGHNQGFTGFLFLLGTGWGCGCGRGCRAGVRPGFDFVPLYLQILIKIKILNSIKTKYPKLM